MPLRLHARNSAGLVLALALVLAAPVAAQRSTSTLVFPASDPILQPGLDRILARPPFASLVRAGRLSVTLVDVTVPSTLRYAGHDDDHERYAASLPKIGILLGVFAQIEEGRLRYTPELRSKMEAMIRRSDNAVSSELIRLVGFGRIEAALRDPKHELYDEDRAGGIWVGRGYGGMGTWRRDPIGNQSHGATARQAARFLVMMDRGELVSPWASREMKEILGEPEIHHKFVAGLASTHPESRIYRKSGTWDRWHADAALVERDGRKYVAVALLDAPDRVNGSQILSSLIVALDDLVFSQSPVVLRAAEEGVREAPGRGR